ncbi:hypothetical protein [Ruminococcus sp.]|uniref:hypothetical protein n=1 Tax=Ruminococcus sp. TaxID=41978 RepID=UPI0025DAE024|nr:hypothetical protein [Ruminococcus sp.]MBQ8967505.1 hypothetical protein [Ruminococcus sp.]
MAIDDKKTEDDKVEELVAMIDELITKGDGHVNVKAGEVTSEDGATLNVQTFRTNDCGTGACCQPNEKAPDEDEEL